MKNAIESKLFFLDTLSCTELFLEGISHCGIPGGLSDRQGFDSPRQAKTINHIALLKYSIASFS